MINHWYEILGCWYKIEERNPVDIDRKSISRRGLHVDCLMQRCSCMDTALARATVCRWISAKANEAGDLRRISLSFTCRRRCCCCWAATRVFARAFDGRYKRKIVRADAAPSERATTTSDPRPWDVQLSRGGIFIGCILLPPPPPPPPPSADSNHSSWRTDCAVVVLTASTTFYHSYSFLFIFATAGCTLY